MICFSLWWAKYLQIMMGASAQKGVEEGGPLFFGENSTKITSTTIFIPNSNQLNLRLTTKFKFKRIFREHNLISTHLKPESIYQCCKIFLKYTVYVTNKLGMCREWILSCPDYFIISKSNSPRFGCLQD